MRVRYGVSFVSSKSDPCYTFVNVMLSLQQHHLSIMTSLATWLLVLQLFRLRTKEITKLCFTNPLWGERRHHDISRHDRQSSNSPICINKIGCFLLWVAFSHQGFNKGPPFDKAYPWGRMQTAGLCFPLGETSSTVAQVIAECIWTLIARFMGPTWGPSGADRTQVGPMLASWTLLSGLMPIHS